MKTIKVTPLQRAVLESLTRKDLNTVRRHPGIVKEGKHLIKACKRVIEEIADLHEYANAKKRKTAYGRIVKLCRKALERVER